MKKIEEKKPTGEVEYYLPSERSKFQEAVKGLMAIKPGNVKRKIEIILRPDHSMGKDAMLVWWDSVDNY